MPSLFQRLFAADDEQTRPQSATAEVEPPHLVARDTHVDLIPAEELPSAVDALHALFADERAAESVVAETPATKPPAAEQAADEVFVTEAVTAEEKPTETLTPSFDIVEDSVRAAQVEASVPETVASIPYEETPTPESAAPTADSPKAPEVREERKRRGFFSWLFAARQGSRAHSRSTHEVTGPEPSLQAQATPLAETIAAPDAHEAADAPNSHDETSPIPASELAPAAHILHELFAEHTGHEAITAKDSSVAPQTSAPVIAKATDSLQASDPAADAAADPQPQVGSVNASGSFAATRQEDSSSHAVQNALRLAESIEHDELKSGVSREEFVVDANNDDVHDAPPASPDSSKDDPSGEPTADQVDAELLEASRQANANLPPRKAYRDWALDDKLASHREWVDSQGMSGQRADLSGAELGSADLISVNLRMADLHDADLRAADLLLADLRDACLVRADLEESCLVGANLEGANLEGASLETAMGLVPRQFAGANLRDALLDPHLMEFQAATPFHRNAQHASRYFKVITLTSLLSWLLIWKTHDIQLVADSAILSFLHSRAAAAALPTAESYLLIPVVLFVLYLVFNFHLQRLWESTLELPAVFPDGHVLGDGQSSIIVGLLRTHFRWMNPDASSARLVEKTLSLLLSYWLAPLTLLFYWARYLTRQEIHGTFLHAVLTAAATGIALHATTKVGRAQERWATDRKWTDRLFTKFAVISPVTFGVVFAAILLLLSAGTIAGVPHDVSRAPQYRASSVRRWAPTLFWWLGFDPYPDLTEAAISAPPRSWNLPDDQVGSIDGARLNGRRIRYAQAYRAFLANGHLWRSDLRGAFFSDSDLRNVDLGQSNLKFAVMDHARLYHANLDRADLEGADLNRADLRSANLSYAMLSNAGMVDARLDGATLYTAGLEGSNLTRANLEKADLRDARLNVAHMDHADLQGAYLWSAQLPGADLGGAQLSSAIFIEANLRGANLGGAKLTGTVLNNANLSGSSLEGADLRGALGVTASQVCSSRSHTGVMLDADLRNQVDALCGNRPASSTLQDKAAGDAAP